MCTAINQGNFFGRNLDYEHDFGEEVVIMPRRFPLKFTEDSLTNHFALVGMAKIEEGYPLFFDAMNEKGLAAAGLNFVGNAHYNSPEKGKRNVASFEFIPYILTHAESVSCAKELLKEINITDIPFSEKLPPSQLHFIISDKEGSITAEPREEGLLVYENPAEVLTNNPEFPYHMYNLTNYLNVTSAPATNRFSKKLPLPPFSRGMGGIGLPGDLSSTSRFVRAAFMRGNSKEESLSQFFHLLTATEQVLGAAEVNKGEFEMTLYSSACDREGGIYYYTTYRNRRITGIDTKKYDLNGHTLLTFPLKKEEDISFEE